jgi:AraC-like DNA-binding protein
LTFSASARSLVHMPDVVRTNDLPAGQRFDFWKAALAQAFAPLEVTDPADGGDFRGRLSGSYFGTARLIDVRADSHTAIRTPRLVATAPVGCYKLGLQLSGSAVLIQDGREATLTPGAFALYDADRPYTLALAGQHRQLILMFPHELLRLPPSSVARLTAIAMPGDEPGAGRLIPSFLTQVFSVADEAAPNSAVRLAGNVLDLLTTVLAERLERLPGDAETPGRALLLRMMAFIEEHLADPYLSPQVVADAHHVSLRQVHKLFHAGGSTVASWIRQRRLERCRRDLLDPVVAALPVSAIGARWGYPDPAHFSRLFKSSYGVSPREFRHSRSSSVHEGARRP